MLLSFPTSVLLANFTILQKMRSVLAVLARSEGDIYLNILIEFAKDRNHPVEREAAKLCVADMREFGVRNPVCFSASRVESLRSSRILMIFAAIMARACSSPALARLPALLNSQTLDKTT
jgi:hypothetical protein